MRTLPLLLCLLLPLLAGAAPRTSRRSVSANGVYRVQMVVEAEGQCRLEVSSDSGLQWVLQRCVGGADDAYFVSRDGRSVWVVHTLPEKAAGKARYRGKGRKRRLVAPGWARSVVAERFGAEGERLEVRRLSQLMGTAGYGKVRELKRHFTWLEGTNGVPGPGPRLDAEGGVVLRTVEGKQVVLPLP